MGVLRAMRELGIPVDIVGGTSIGSMIGGLFAETPDSTLELRAKTWFTVRAYGLLWIYEGIYSDDTLSMFD